MTNRFKILVLDDEEENRLAMRDVCKKIGFDVFDTDDGKAALKEIQNRSWLAVISIWKMPKMNGGEFFRRAIPMNPNVACWILMTAVRPKASKELREFLQEFPNVTLWKKPAVFSELASLVQISHQTH